MTKKDKKIMTLSCTFIHGWGANCHIFDDFRRRLPENWQTFAPDLLGHGSAPLNGDFSVERAAEAIAQNIATPTYIFGWSLGGLVGLHLAVHFPEKVKGLILCNSFAKLLAEPDYPEGLAQSSLNKMIPLFEQDYPKYMRQFLQLQLLNTPQNMQIIEKLLPDMVKNGSPTALRGALAAVEAADMRAKLPEIHQPILLIYGNKDTITPPRMGEYLARHLPHSQMHVLDKAAHAPFLSHADELAQILQDWLK